MIARFVIPVVDTESGTYEYDGELTTDQFNNMVMDRFRRTNNQMNAYVSNYGSYGSGLGGGFVHDIQEDNRVIDDDTKFIFNDSIATIMDSDGYEIDEDDLRDFARSGKKFILKVDINPNEIDSDAESEIRYWMDDSDMVLTDNTLDKKTCLLSLPRHDFIIDCEIDDPEHSDAPIFTLSSCRIVQIYKKNNKPFFFAMIVERITEE